MALQLPDTLTPSKISRFVQCPLSFRYSYIDRIPEPPTSAQFLGTLVHRALQLFFTDTSADARTPTRARQALESAWSDPRSRVDLESLSLGESGNVQLLGQASTLLQRYFELESPTAIEAIGIELDLRHPLDGIELRGIIDRLDRLADGSLVVIDYKTGRAPRQEFARSSMIGVHFYAYLCEHVYGQRPREVRLLYLKDRIVVVESPTDQSMRGLRQRALAVWHAIERACEEEDFRPNPSRLCGSCAYRSICPAMNISSVPVALVASHS